MRYLYQRDFMSFKNTVLTLFLLFRISATWVIPVSIQDKVKYPVVSFYLPIKGGHLIKVQSRVCLLPRPHKTLLGPICTRIQYKDFRIILNGP